MPRLLFALVLSWFSTVPALAAALGGVTQPDTVTVAGQTLQLNGLGLRKKAMFQVMVAGLYLPEKTTDHVVAIQSDVPKRLVLHFTIKSVSKEQLVGQVNDNIHKIPEGPGRDGMIRWAEAMEPLSSGDEVVMDYVPGEGVHVSVKGTEKDVIEGVEFMQVFWASYLGEKADKQTRAGLLGG